MAPPRTTLAALVFAALLVTVSLVLLSPLGASAQVTHSGTFSLDSTNSQVGTYKVTGPADSVVLTVCVTSGDDVEVLADGNPATGLGNVGLHGCKTRKLLLNKISISLITGGLTGTSKGTYSLSLNMP